MEFLKANIGTIAVGAIVFAVLAAVVIRLAGNYRKGKTACGCGCPGCATGAGVSKKAR
jgi:hypothetical protein